MLPQNPSFNSKGTDQLVTTGLDWWKGHQYMSKPPHIAQANIVIEVPVFPSHDWNNVIQMTIRRL